MSTRDIFEPVVAVEGRSRPEWLQAADVVIGTHRSRRRARRWVGAVRRRYPGCTVALSRSATGRWCVVGVADHMLAVSVHSGRMAPPVELARIVFGFWVGGRPAGPEVRS